MEKQTVHYEIFTDLEKVNAWLNKLIEPKRDRSGAFSHYIDHLYIEKGMTIYRVVVVYHRIPLESTQ